ncbi:MAG TPA: hypothetical protein VG602_09595 [Actinomycetota bacterium]|nr:hypothetical protein [Actinomycetota bacterium]
MSRAWLLVTLCLAAMGCTKESEPHDSPALGEFSKPVRDSPGYFEACPVLDGSLDPDGGRGADAAAIRFTTGGPAAKSALADPAARPNGLNLQEPWGKGVLGSRVARDVVARSSCGRDVARRSWRVTIDDGSSSASLDTWLYLIRRADGWKVWGSY